MDAPLSLPRLLPSGDSAITVEFSRTIDDAANRRVLALDRTLSREPVAGVTETVPTYRSLLVHYDPLQIDFETLSGKLTTLAQLPVPPSTNTRRWRRDDSQPSLIQAERVKLNLVRLTAAADGSKLGHTPSLRRARAFPAGAPSASRVPGSMSRPRRTLPVSSPLASGKNGRTPSPKCLAAGTTSASASRSSRDQWFCAETKAVTPISSAVWAASASCQPVRFE